MPYRLDCEDAPEKKEGKSEKGLTMELLKSRTIVISDEISEEVARSFYAQLLVLNERSSTDPITVYINSPGGDADSGFGMYDMLRFIDAPVTTLCCGLCASAAILVFLAADKGRNFSLPNSRFLLHQPSTGIRGTASDIQITAEEILNTRKRYNKIVAEVTGKAEEEIANDADRDFWIGTERAVEYGLVSKIVQSRNEL